MTTRDANARQYRRIERIHRILSRRQPGLTVNDVGRHWIDRYAEKWRRNAERRWGGTA